MTLDVYRGPKTTIQQQQHIKCNGVIQNLGTDVTEKYFMTKSVSALHPILPVYFNILSPDLDLYSNFEIVMIFELENIG